MFFTVQIIECYHAIEKSNAIMRQVARREYAAKVDNRAVNANGEVLLVASALFPLKGVGGGHKIDV